MLNGWKLQFKQFATIEPDAAYSTPVLVWEISERDERNLDVYEGYPTLYYKQKVPIKVFRMDSGEPMLVHAMVYIMNDGHIDSGVNIAVNRSVFFFKCFDVFSD